MNELIGIDLIKFLSDLSKVVEKMSHHTIIVDEREIVFTGPETMLSLSKKMQWIADGLEEMK